MSFSTLNIGASALFATQRAVEVAGQNVANAAVDGYSRQVVQVTSATPTPGTSVGDRSDGMRGNGVVVTSVDRLRDQLADVAYRSEADADGYAGARSTTLDRAQSILGSVSDGVPATLDKFWAAFDALSNNPTDTAARNTVLNAGSEISRAIRDASSQLGSLTSDAATQVSGDVTSINNLATQVAKLNKSILDAKTAGQSPNDLLDSRDRAIDQLHKLAGVTTHENSLGVVDVYIGSRSLVRGEQTTPLKSGVPAGGGAPTVTWSDDGSSVTPGGEVGGYLSVTNVDLPGLKSMLDSVAKGLISAVNTVHAGGYGLPPGGTGTSTTTGTPFFSGTDASNVDLAAGLTATTLAASASGAANDGNNAIALAALRGKTNAVTLPDGTTASVGDALRAVGGKLGSLASAAAATHSATNTAVSSADKARASANGVSVDEEMVDLVKWQHAYSAAAKVISTADSMLDTLINRLGA
jgi:flagellar hook-associated protein 1 FlgK